VPRTIIRYTTKRPAEGDSSERALTARALREKEVVANPDIDGYFAKLAKYIPAEITAAFLAVNYLLDNASPAISGNMYWAVFAVIVVVTPLYFWMVSIIEGKDKPDIPQLIVAPIAFVIWAFALGGPFIAALSWYQPALAQVAVVLATVIIPIADTIITHLMKLD